MYKKPGRIVMKELRVHHIGTLGAYIIFKEKGEEGVFEDFMKKENYGIDFSKRIKEVFEEILSDDDLELRITNNTDYICKECPNTAKKCSPGLARYEKEITKSLGIKIGQVYMSREIIEIARKTKLGEMNYKGIKKEMESRD